MAKKIAVITGAAGFIGSHLCDRLLSDGLRVIGLDNFITGSCANIAHLNKSRDFIFQKQDATNNFTVTGSIHYVLHLASPASPEDYLAFPIQTLGAGAQGTENALQLAKSKKARFILASTSEVYGDPERHPQKESYWGNVNSVGIRSCYDEAKRFAEALSMAYLRKEKVNTGIVRIFNTYGPRMRAQDGRVVPNFIYQALRHKSLTIYGAGKQTRSFCYVSDLVDGIVRLMHSKIHLPVNIGNPCEFTIMQLARIVAKLTQTKAKFVYKPLPEDDPKQRKPDITLARQLLKWQPAIKLEQGLELTIGWFKGQA